MNTDNPNDNSPTPPAPVTPPETSNPIPDLVNTLSSVDTTTPEAAENATSMSDGKGGRITFNEDLPKSDTHDR